MTQSEKLLDLQTKFKAQMLKALKHLEYSYKKSLNLPVQESQMSEEILEVWESFSSRFSRVVDIYTTKYLRTFVLMNDPAFEGSFRDLLDHAEKLRLIADADFFMKMRELRNIHAHDYREDKLAIYLTDLRTHAPELLKIKL